MRARLLIALLPTLLCCAPVTGEGGIPVHAPPFTSDARVVRPSIPTGELDVEAYPPSPTSKLNRPNGPWRLFDSEGRPITATFRENAQLALPIGWYVVIGRDPNGSLHLAQVEVGAGAVTKLSLPRQGLPLDASYAPNYVEE